MNSPEPKELYPEIRPVKTYRLKVSRLHTRYVEECGNPKGIPALFLHGDPDAGYAAFEPGIRSALIEATERYKW